MKRSLVGLVLGSCCALLALSPRAARAADGESSFTPDSFRPISQPESAAISVRSLQSPRWPMRNILPLSLPRPVPSEQSKRS